MAAFSLLRPLVAPKINFCALLKRAGGLKASQNALQHQLRKMSGGHDKTMPIAPSRFHYFKFKDMLHFYTMLGLIPVGLLIFYVNVFIGPATLTETPEGYRPKHWEYHRHPISRFLARYVYTSPQQEYEKMCHYIFEEHEIAELRRLEKKIKAKMAERQDYQAYYYVPFTAKYHRYIRKQSDDLDEIHGD